MTERRIIKKTIVKEGDELPCHQDNIIHTHLVRKFDLKIYYVEDEN